MGCTGLLGEVTLMSTGACTSQRKKAKWLRLVILVDWLTIKYIDMCTMKPSFFFKKKFPRDRSLFRTK